jgi:hypothetical protein
MHGTTMDDRSSGPWFGSQAVQAEAAGAHCEAMAVPSGEVFLTFGGPRLPSLDTVYFSLACQPGSTLEQARELAARINALGCQLVAEYTDGLGAAVYPLRENGLADLD